MVIYHTILLQFLRNADFRCECAKHDQTPMDSNKRRACEEVAKKVGGEEVWFGIEQEYTLLDSDGRPLGWPKSGFPAPQG